MRRPCATFRCAVLLLSASLLACHLGAEEVSKATADEIVSRYLRGASLKTPAAQRELESAVDLYRRTHDAPALAKGLVLLGMAHDAADRHEQAMASYREAERSLEALGDGLGLAILALHMGDAETLARRHAAAEAHYARAFEKLSALEQSGEKTSSAMLVFFLRFLGIPPELFDGGEAGIELFVNMIRPLLLDLLQLNAVLRLGETRLDLANCTGARNALEQARNEVAKIRISQVGPLVAQVFEGQLNSAWGQLEKTCGRVETTAPARVDAATELAELHQEMDKARQAGDRVAEAELLARQAAVFQFWGDFEEAADSFERSLALFRRLPDLGRRARAFDALGVHMVLWSRYEKGLTNLEQSLALFRQLGKELDVAATLIWLGSAKALLGLHEAALDQLEEARRLAKKHGGLAIEREALYALAEIHLRRGAPEEALKPLQDYLTSMADRGSPNDHLEALTAGAALLVRLERDAEAEPMAIRAAAMAEQLGVEYFASMAQVSLAQLAWRRGSPDRAFEHLERALGTQRANGLRYAEAASSALKGLWLVRRGKAAEGIALYRKAIDLYEDVQGQLKVPDLLSGLHDQSGYRLYVPLIEILAAQGMTEDAFEYAERARARAFLNLLGNRRLGRPGRGHGQLVARAEGLRDQLRALGARPEAPEASRLAADPRRQKIDSLRSDYARALLDLKLADPEYASLVAVDPLHLEDVQRELPADATLISYFVTDSGTHAWVVDRTAAHYHSLPMKGSDLRQVPCWAEVVGRTRSARPKEVCELVGHPEEDLYTKLIAPLRAHLRHRRLILIPHRELHYVPFAALRDAKTGRYLVEAFTLTYAPSASVLGILRGKESPIKGKALVLGDSDQPDPNLDPLRFAALEARAVARLFGARSLLGAEATEAGLRRLSGGVDLLHVAAHGVYEPRSPLFSRIALAPGKQHDGNLEVHEIFSDLDLSGVNLVVLSACETARGERTRGDEITGLTRAFLYAGAPAVISTLWKIDDRASAILIESFYRRLLDGAPAAEALRQAQLSLLRKPEYQNPYFWAAFSLTGDPRGTWSISP